jgi:hypothetical protein
MVIATVSPRIERAALPYGSLLRIHFALVPNLLFITSFGSCEMAAQAIRKQLERGRRCQLLPLNP